MKIPVQTRVVVQELGDRRSAFVTWTSVCPVCGEMQLVWPAHHWRSLHALLTKALAQYPELAPELEVVDEIAFSGQSPADPTTN